MNKKTLPWHDLGYFILLCFFLAQRTWVYTMFRQFKKMSLLNRYTTAALLILVVLKVICSKIYSICDILVSLLLIGVFWVVYRNANPGQWFMCIPFLIVGAKGIQFDRIVRCYLICVGGIIGAACVASWLGIIENLQYTLEANRGVRYAMGTSYPTTFSEFVFFLVISWGYLRRNKLTIAELFAMMGLAFILKYCCDARTDYIMVFAAVFVFTVFRLEVCRKYMGNKILCILLTFVMPMLAVLMNVIAYYYDWWCYPLRVINEFVNRRPEFGKIGFVNYGLSWFGQYVKYIGTGRSTETVENYFNLDSSYNMILINYGVVFFAVLISCFIFNQIKAIRKKNAFMIWIVALIAVECALENRLHQPQYNIFLLYPFAADSLDTFTGFKKSSE